MKPDLIYILGTHLIFGLIVEYKIGNIWYRTNYTGKRSIDIRLLLKFMISPLYKREMWSPYMIPYNYFVFMTVLSLPWIYLW